MPKAQKVDRPVLPTFGIAINGTPLSRATAAHVASVTIDDDLGLPAMFAFDLAGADDQKASSLWADAEQFAIGGVVELKLGYLEKMETLLVGEITALEPEFGLDHLPNLTVRGYDRLHRLQRGRRTRTFTQQKDSDAATKIAGDAGLTSNGVVDTKVTHEYLVQANQTDFEFLSQRATQIGYELRIDDKKLLFRPVQNAKSAGVTLSFHSDLLEFHPRLTAAQQVDAVSLRLWSVKEKNNVLGQARAGEEVATMGGKKTGPALAQSAFGSAVEQITAWSASSQAEADQFVKARVNDIALDFITGEGTCWGRTDLRAGTVIQISDIGKRFSGPYYLSRVRHRYGAPGYVTEFSVRRSAS